MDNFSELAADRIRDRSFDRLPLAAREIDIRLIL